MVSLEEPEIRWTSKCPRYCIVLLASAAMLFSVGGDK